MAASVAGKNIHDQLGTVDHSQLGTLLDIATLPRGDGIVDDDQLSLELSGQFGQFFQFSLADIGPRMGAVTLLLDHPCNPHTGSICQCRDLCDRIDSTEV